jgi:hypothetical protein
VSMASHSSEDITIVAAERIVAERTGASEEPAGSCWPQLLYMLCMGLLLARGIIDRYPNEIMMVRQRSIGRVFQEPLTELQVSASNDGIIEYYRREVEKMRGGGIDIEMVTLRALSGVSHVSLMSGRKCLIGGDRLMRVSPADAKPLRGAGFEEVALP